MTTKRFNFLRCELETVRLGDLEPMDTFCFAIHNRSAAYVEPGERPEWGGVPWQATGHRPTGGVYALPGLTVYRPRREGAS